MTLRLPRGEGESRVAAVQLQLAGVGAQKHAVSVQVEAGMTAYLLLKVFCACLIVTGGAFVTVGLVRYHKMVNFIRLTGSGVRESFVQRVPELFLVFFLVGFCVGFLHVSFNEVAPVFLFISVVFFAGGSFSTSSSSIRTRPIRRSRSISTRSSSPSSAPSSSKISTPRGTRSTSTTS